MCVARGCVYAVCALHTRARTRRVHSAPRYVPGPGPAARDFPRVPARRAGPAPPWRSQWATGAGAGAGPAPFIRRPNGLPRQSIVLRCVRRTSAENRAARQLHERVVRRHQHVPGLRAPPARPARGRAPQQGPRPPVLHLRPAARPGAPPCPPGQEAAAQGALPARGEALLPGPGAQPGQTPARLSPARHRLPSVQRRRGPGPGARAGLPRLLHGQRAPRLPAPTPACAPAGAGDGQRHQPSRPGRRARPVAGAEPSRLLSPRPGTASPLGVNPRPGVSPLNSARRNPALTSRAS